MSKQSFWYLLSILVSALMLNACATVGMFNNPRGSFQVKLWVDRQQPLKVGDAVTAIVRADRSCYLNVYYISGSGTIRQIFPDNLRSDNRIDAGISYRIPRPGAGYRFTLKYPPTKEALMAIATLKPVMLVPPDKMDYSGVIPKVKMKESRFQHAIKNKLKELPSNTWSADTFYFTYGP